MSATPKKRLCWNCDGSLSLAVDQCTYCGASLKEGANPKQAKKKSSDPLAPPFAMLQEAKPAKAPQPPFDVLGKRLEEEEEEPPVVEAANSSDSTTVFSSLLFLLGGSVFFLFGLVLWLFSQNGVFTLHWNGDYWYVYLSGGLALLGLGCRALKGLNEQAA